jgi:hypothetical protein
VTVKLEIQGRIMQATRATHSPLIQGVDDLTENTERLINGCGLLQSGRIVACHLRLTQSVRSDRVDIEVLAQNLVVLRASEIDQIDFSSQDLEVVSTSPSTLNREYRTNFCPLESV